MIDVRIAKFAEHDWLGVGFYDIGQLIKLECKNLGIKVNVDQYMHHDKDRPYHVVSFDSKEDWNLFRLTRKLKNIPATGTEFEDYLWETTELYRYVV